MPEPRDMAQMEESAPDAQEVNMTEPERRTALVYVRVSRLDREDRQRQRDDGPDAKLRALSPTTQLEQVKMLSRWLVTLAN